MKIRTNVMLSVMLGLLLCAPLPARGAEWSGGTPPTVSDGDTVTISGAPSGTLTVPAGAAVTIDGTVSNAAKTLAFDIDDGAKIIWKASLTGGAVSGPSQGQGGIPSIDPPRELISVTGCGVFEVQSGEINSTKGTAVLANGNEYVGPYPDPNSSPLDIYTGGTVVVTGGTVRATGSGSAISAKDVTVSGGTVSAKSGAAIYGYNSDVGIGTSEGEFITECHITVSGGTVSAATGEAIYAGGDDTVTVDGGFVFAYGAAAADVISRSYTRTGSGVIAAWDTAAGTGSYTEGTAVDLTVDPAGAAVWGSNGTSGGIKYNTGGFFPISGVTVNGPADAETPGITGQPQGATVTAGKEHELKVIASVSDGGTLSYQWYRNTLNSASGGDAVGTNSSVYKPSTAAVGTAYYYVAVTNTNNGAGGAKTAKAVSGTAKVTVNNLVNAQAPNITGQPQSAAVTAGAAHSLNVAASVSDGGTLTYQWYRNGSAVNSGGAPIHGASKASYAPPAVTAGTYYYYAVVTNTIADNGDGGAKKAAAASEAAAFTVTDAEPGAFTVTFDSRGGSAVTPFTNVQPGTTINRPNPPARAGYVLNGWYRDAAARQPWNFAADRVTGNITLYAGWWQSTGGGNGSENFPGGGNNGGSGGGGCSAGFGVAGIFAAALPLFLSKRKK